MFFNPEIPLPYLTLLNKNKKETTSWKMLAIFFLCSCFERLKKNNKMNTGRSAENHSQLERALDEPQREK